MILGLDHVGIVVGDLAAASAALERLLERGAEAVEGAGGAFDARVFDMGGVSVELIRFSRPIPGVDPSVFYPVPGIQHLAFRVDDLGTAVQTLRGFGVEPLEGFPRSGVHGKIAFFREPGTGLLFELVER